MSENPAVILENVTKKFTVMHRRYGLKSLLLHLPNYLHDRLHPDVHTVLDQVSLTINRGERVGIIGVNGSGKTTLLSIIGNVIKKYDGKCTVNGRISMMLALKSGFVNNLSGRENIIINGVLQGVSRREMLRLSDEIIEFSGIGEFIDSPVYQYSSGMQARLGFAIATATKPDILLVDEVLAVGDDDFRQRCAERIKELIANDTTLLLVSHKMEDIKKHCTRVVKLDHGRVATDCPTQEYFKK